MSNLFSDILDRVTNITYRSADGTAVQSFDYAYDAANLITQQISVADGQAVTNTYAYDGLGRLITANDTSYTYDLAGNRLSAGAETFTYTHNRLDGIAYDAAGNVTSMVRDGVSLSLTWNSQHQLVSVSTNNVLAESYAYDTLGRRISTTKLTTDHHSPATEYHIYDGDECIADLDASGNPLRTYLWGPGIDNLLSMTVFLPDSTNTYYAVKDHLGSVHALVDQQGQIAASYTYDAWGNTLSHFSTSELENFSCRYCFQGREYSSATGLYNFRARWYDPVTARWLSNDPIGISGGLNLYEFCGSNPMNFVDPVGCSWVKGIGIGLAGIAGGVVVSAVIAATAPAWAVVALGVTASAAGGFMTGVNLVEYASGKTYFSGQDLSWDERTTRGGQVLISAATLGVGGTKWFSKGANRDLDWIKLPASQRLRYSKDLITVADDVARGFTAPPGQRGVRLPQWRPLNLYKTMHTGADSALRHALPYGLSGAALGGAVYGANNDNCK